MIQSEFERAAIGATGLSLQPLPDEVMAILSDVGASPRLLAHLRLVHDVARRLVGEIASAWPQLRFDEEAVLYGAAIHDIGKAVYCNELVDAGSEHEAAGHALLLDRGVPERHARFARTHSRWAEESATIEDLLVALADRIWRGRRHEDLEMRVVLRISAAAGGEPWQVFSRLDDLLTRIAEPAEERLRFQAQFSEGTGN